MRTRNNQYYMDILKDMDEEQAVDFAIAKVREAIEDTRRTNERLEKALDLMEAIHLSR
jgi:hypothetical protein